MNDFAVSADKTHLKPYAALQSQFSRLHHLEGGQGILHWDAATMMPKGGSDSRTEQLAVLAVLYHEILTSPAIGAQIEAAKAQKADLRALDQVNLMEMERLYRHATAVPGRLVEALSKAGSKCEHIWREARPESDFAKVLPAFKELLSLTQEMAQAKSEALGLSPYDALMDQFDPGARTAMIDPIFAELEAFLPDFIQKALEAQAQWGALPAVAGPFPIEQQKTLAETMMGVLGFEFDHGRLDVSAHPFCGGTARDVRITTRYDRTDYESALMGVLHETGHALYEMGLPEASLTQPIGKPRGMAVHESQSLLMEMQVCRSQPFLQWALPTLKKAFPALENDPAWTAENLYRRAIRVERGFIRVDADEVTYPAHIILRYRLERQLLEGRLDPQDLPSAWNAAMQDLLGVTPPNDRLGCLQDIHWYDGAFGYFPSYTIGAMIAAQLFAAAQKADAAIAPGIGQGDLLPLRQWLRQNIHDKGSSLSLQELLMAATGEGLNPKIFMAHLQNRYLP